MTRFACFVAGALLVLAADLPAQNPAEKGKDAKADDPVAADLAAAKKAYRAAVAGAADKLDQEIKGAIKEVENAPNLTPQARTKLREDLIAQSKAFEADRTKVPDHPRLKADRLGYETELKKARKAAEGAYQKAFDRLDKAKRFDESGLLQQEMKEFFATPPRNHAGFYKSNVQPDQLIELAAKGAMLINKAPAGKWVGDGDRCEIEFDTGWSLKLTYDPKQKALVGKSYSDKGKVQKGDRVLTPVPK